LPIVPPDLSRHDSEGSVLKVQGGQGSYDRAKGSVAITTVPPESQPPSQELNEHCNTKLQL
jgi:hypothetical protein